MSDTIKVVCKPCPVCRISEEMILDIDKVSRWLSHGEHVQNVWPEMPAERREMLISGTHPSCFETLFGDDEEEECSECGDPLDDGEGWDGLCGNCADRQYREEEE